MAIENASRQRILTKRLSPVSRAWAYFKRKPGVPLRYTPGFMLTPAPQAERSERLSSL